MKSDFYKVQYEKDGWLKEKYVVSNSFELVVKNNPNAKSIEKSTHKVEILQS